MAPAISTKMPQPAPVGQPVWVTGLQARVQMRTPAAPIRVPRHREPAPTQSLSALQKCLHMLTGVGPAEMLTQRLPGAQLAVAVQAAPSAAVPAVWQERVPAPST